LTEYADGGTLWDLTAGSGPDAPHVAMDEATVKEIVLAILDGLCTLQRKRHRSPGHQAREHLALRRRLEDRRLGISKLRSSPVTGFTMQGAHSLPWAPPEQRDALPLTRPRTFTRSGA